MDVFQVEAVSLGKLEMCIVGHDGTGAGQGWYLDKIVVQESDDSKTKFVFPCER